MYQPRESDVKKGFYKLIDGVWHKRCTGPAHDEPTYLPANEKYFYLSKSAKSKTPGAPLARCRLCSNWAVLKSPGSESGFLRIHEVQHFYLEAANRIGLMELSRRTGIHKTTLHKACIGRGTYVQKASFKKVLLELISIRRKNEYSINTYKSNAQWRAVKRSAGNELCGECSRVIVEGEYTEECKKCQDRRSYETMKKDPARVAKRTEYQREYDKEKRNKSKVA